MQEKLIYLFSAVAVGWAVTFALRLLPFGLFARSSRKTQTSLAKFGEIVSPVVIGGLIVYSFSTLKLDGAPAWRTFWPYLAVALTVALHLLFRNSLASIAGGTVFYMLLVGFLGCTSLPSSIEFDARNPVVRISGAGVTFAGQFVAPEKVPRLLRHYDIPLERTIHIHISGGLHDLRPARQLMAILCRAGYRRPVLVTERTARSEAVKPDTGKFVRPPVEPRRKVYR